MSASPYALLIAAAPIPAIAALILCAWRFGGPAERAASAMFGLQVMVYLSYAAVFRRNVDDTWSDVIEVGTGFGFLYVAFRYTRLWTGLLLLAQSAQLGIRALDSIGVDMTPLLHYYLTNLLSAGILVIIIFAVLAAAVKAWSTARAESRDARLASSEASRGAIASSP